MTATQTIQYFMWSISGFTSNLVTKYIKCIYNAKTTTACAYSKFSVGQSSLLFVSYTTSTKIEHKYKFWQVSFEVFHTFGLLTHLISETDMWSRTIHVVSKVFWVTMSTGSRSMLCDRRLSVGTIMLVCISVWNALILCGLEDQISWDSSGLIFPLFLL